MKTNSESIRRALLRPLLAAFLISLAGCAAAPAPVQAPPRPQAGPQVLQAGDVVRISLPAAPNLESTQQIRRDGFLNLALVGEVRAEGKTAAELEADLASRYGSQLVSKEVKVTIVSSSFAVFVTGAVIRPGKIQPDHAVTVFDAVMEAGGFDLARANTKSVRVIRTRNGSTQSFTLDLSPLLAGEPATPFFLESNDAVYVPERFQWF